MNQEIREQLSALIDNELDRDRARFLLKRAEHDGELVALWQRWHLTGEVMRGTALPLGRDFLQGIHARLELDVPAKITQPGHARLWRWGGGFAVAASVALSALLLVRPQGPDVTVPAEAAVAANSTKVPAPASVVVPSPYRVQDLRPPYRLDAQVVAASEAGNYGTQARFDPDFEAYWLRHQQAVNGRVESVPMPWLSPLHPDVAEAAGTH